MNSLEIYKCLNSGLGGACAPLEVWRVYFSLILEREVSTEEAREILNSQDRPSGEETTYNDLTRRTW